jgi:KaiC
MGVSGAGPETTIPSALVTWCDAVARATALLLYCCEDRPAETAVRLSNSAADEFLKEAAQKAGSEKFRRPGGPDAVRGTILSLPLAREPREGIASVERRLAKLVLSKWASTVREGTPARPDVLALTTRLLTNPDAAFTYHIARFSLLAALRSLYQVSYDQRSLSRLRLAYNHLRGDADVSAGPDSLSDARYQALILDVLHVEGWLPRHVPRNEPAAYYERFADHVLGVPGDLRDIAAPEHPADLRRRLPDFGTLQGLLFAHPTGVAGLDFVTGGLLPTIQNPESGQTGGLATLISGPPGTGKTSLCLTLGTRMAELGSHVSYVTMEEGPDTLKSKRESLVEPLSVSLAVPLGCVERLATPTFRVIGGSEFTTLTELAALLEHSDDMPEYGAVPVDEPVPEVHPGAQLLDFTLVFPRVVIIDSVTALLQIAEDRATEVSNSVPAAPEPPPKDGAPPAESRADEGRDARTTAYPTRIELRRTLAQTLNALRKQGVCVILVAGAEDGKDEALAYLVDNVFALSVEDGEDRSHPRITLSVEKMRFQNTQRERHVFHLAGPDGPTVSPSLHAVLRRLDRLPHQSADPSVRAFVWEDAPSTPHPRGEPGGPGEGRQARRGPLTMYGHSQTLVYGFGASGKSRFAMSLAMEARVPRADRDHYDAYMERRATGMLTQEDRLRLSEARVLVVSFQYGPEYYRRLATETLRQRFDCTSEHPEKHVDVIDFYPGAVDAESVVRRVRMRLRHGEVNGTPHTAVVLDGVHNIVAQFPSLANEPLLWPTVYQLLRTYGIDTITTFTFFRIPSPNHGSGPASGDIQNEEELHDVFDRTQRSRKVRDVEEKYFQTLVTNCDYSFVIEPPLAPPHPRLRNVVRIQLSSSVDREVNAPLRIIWDADAFSQKQEYPVRYDDDPKSSEIT